MRTDASGPPSSDGPDGDGQSDSTSPQNNSDPTEMIEEDLAPEEIEPAEG